MPGNGQGQPTKIMIVDDDDDDRQSLARILTNAGYDCCEASSGADARARLDSEPDLAAVLCDIRMPGGSGLDLLAHLSADFPNLAVVMTTGVDDPQTAEQAYEIGADGYLIKPFTTNEIIIALWNALKRRRLESARQANLQGLERTIARLRTLTTVLESIETDPPSAHEQETVERLSRAISLRDEETGGHIERMSRYSAVLAEAVGYQGGSIDQVRLATALHDVGKIGVPDTILLKPGPLSVDEYKAMQRHAGIGYQLLASSTSRLLRAAATVAVGHHEWWDGGGYPGGLSGDQIPELARIAAVTDVFDALTSDRVYRPALPVEEAISIMMGLRGRQFEPRLFDAFIGALDQTAAIRQTYPDGDEQFRIRVLVVDDHEIFVQSLVRLLGAQPSIKVIGAARTVAEAQKAAIAYGPDVILMDFELPDGDGVTATERIRILVPTAKVVMLTGRADHDAFARAIAAGCAGLVTKTEPPETLVDAIQAAHEGDSLTGITELPQLLGRLTPTRRWLGPDLGPRELDVLRLVAAGLPNKAIAQRLHISLNTVRNHVQSVLYKLGAHSRLEAVAIAVREGVIEREGRAAPS